MLRSTSSLDAVNLDHAAGDVSGREQHLKAVDRRRVIPCPVDRGISRQRAAHIGDGPVPEFGYAGLRGQLTKKPSNTKAWTSEEDERLRKLIISNASVLDIAADLGRTVKAVRARAHALRIALGRSRFRVNAKAK